jgi:dolichol-phosphate mannosyltransferase
LKLSVVIPARDEEGTIEETVRETVGTLNSAAIEHEVLVVDDHSRDRTPEIVERLSGELRQVRCIPSPYSGGFGLTVRAGLERFEGDAVAVMMADRSDDPRDLVRYHLAVAPGVRLRVRVALRPGRRGARLPQD